MAGSSLCQVNSRVAASRGPAPEVAARTLPELFEAQVMRTPDAVALVFEDQHVTYAALDRRANQLAHLLHQRSVRSDDVVAVALERSPQMVIALMGVLKAGAAFTLLDPTESAARLALLMEGAHAAVIVTDDAPPSLRSLARVTPLNVAESSTISATAAPARSVHPQNVACLVYTENRSATAAALVLTHLDLLIAVEQTVLGGGPGTRLSCGSQLPLDAFIVALCSAFTTGGTLLLDANRRQRSDTSWDAAGSRSATHSLMSLRAIRNMDPAIATERQAVLVLGPSPSLLLTCAERQPSTGGVDEVAVTVAADDTRIYVLDDALQRVPTGVVGELYVAMAPFGTRFFRQPALTATHFVANPYAARGDVMYRVGNRGRWRDDGLLDVVFRKPYRCPEIEAVLLQHPLVEDCVVLSRPSTGGTSEAVAYIVTSGGCGPGELDSLIRSRLPALMARVNHVPVTRLPFTRDGKPDIRALMNVRVIDQDLIACWEQSMRETAATDDLAVVVRERREAVLPLHLWDILSDTDGHVSTMGSTTDTPRERVADGEREAKAVAPAIVDGPPLQDQTRASSNLAAALRRTAAQHGSTEIVCVASDGSRSQMSYAELMAEAELLLSGLRAEGLRAADKVIFQFDRSRDLLTAFWACTLGGFVPVPMSILSSYAEHDVAVQKLHHAWRLLDRPVVLTGGSVASQVALLQASPHFDGVSVVNVDVLRRRPRVDGPWHDAQPDDLALLLLTSGSTGEPKAVMLNHRNILGMLVGVAEGQGLSATDISLNWMPLEHVVGLVMFHIRDVFLGCRQFHVAIDYVLNSPLRWLHLVNEHRVSVTWAPNFAFALINDHAQDVARQTWDLSCLRFIANAGEMIVPATTTRFMTLLAPLGLPQTAMRPAWGMSETSSAATYAQFDPTSGDAFVCVGRPIPGVSLRIVDQQNRAVQEGQIGRLQVRGIPVTRGYYARPDLAAQVFSEDGWFETGDLGFLADGALSVTGRLKDVIIVRGINYYCHEIEAVVEGVDGVLPSYAAACAVRTPRSNTDEIAVFFVSSLEGRERLGQLVRAIRAAVSAAFGIAPDYVVAVSTEDIPKTSIGKIQRSALRARFEKGDFRRQLREADIASRSPRTLPDWFYRTTWRRQAVLHARGQQGQRTVLVFLDDVGVGRELVRELSDGGAACITVVPGSTFGKSGNRSYQLNPHEDGGYARLLGALHEDGITVDDVVHLWAYGPEREHRSMGSGGRHDYAVGSLLQLIQALSEQRRAVPSVSLTVVSSEAHHVESGDRLSAERSMIAGFLTSVAQELPWLTCRHVDVRGDDARRDAADVWRELNARDVDVTVAYRGTARLVRRLEHIKFDKTPRRQAPLESGGLYVITGGLGGIGTYLCDFLVSRYGAKVLLVGRTDYPAPREQSAHESGDAGDLRSRSVALLERLRDHTSYASVDVCDREAFRRAVAGAEARWKTSLRGVFHLAGCFHQRSVLAETRESVLDIARPKVSGTLAIAEALSDRTGLLFVCFSSVNGYFGGFEAAAYAAACSGMDAIVSRLASAGSRTHLVQWSRWSGIGMMKDDPFDDLSRMRGYMSIGVADGLNSLLTVLSHGIRHALVGLDRGNVRIQASCQSTPVVLEQQELCACVEDGSARVANWPEVVEPPADRFGTPSSCQVVRLTHLPRTEEGHIDRGALIRRVSADADRAFDAPANETERRIALIWEELLGVSNLSATASFFEAGGHSLAATQVVARIRREFQIDVTVQQLFAAPTIRQLAAFVAESRSSSTPYQVALRELFREMLGVEQVGLDDDFFALGGNPSLASTLASRVRTELGVELALRTLYECPTVRVLALRLEGGDEVAGGELDPILPLRRRGRLPPLVCLPPAGGLGWRYAGLLGGLDTDRPLYSLQSPGIKDDTPFLPSFDEFVAYYLNLALSVQPAGPYCLLGWSFGGLLAFAMACRLQRMGCNVLSVTLVDAYPLVDTYPPRDDSPDGPPAEVLLSADPQFQAKRKALMADPPPGLQAAHIDRIFELMVHTTGLVRTFKPDRFEGDVLLFPAQQNSKFGSLWKPFVSGTVNIIPIEARHDDVVAPSQLLKVGKSLEQHLGRIVTT